MRLFCTLVLILGIRTSMTMPTSTLSSTGPIEIHNIEHIRVQNNTESTTNQENENLEGKQISEKEEIRFDYPVVTKKGPEYESGRLDIDQLKQKCLHLTKLLNLNKSPTKPSNYERYQEDYRPIYVTTQKPILRSSYTPVTRPSSFYITVPPSNNKISIPTTSAIRYIRLEPVILQKTILSNGRTVYYWHKSLPTAVEYPNKQENVGRDEPYGNYNYVGYNPFYNYYYNPSMYIPSSGNYYNPGHQNLAAVKPTETTTEQSTTTTTEESSFSYGLSHLIPFYGSSGDSTTTTTTEPPTTTSLKYENSLYPQQLRFVDPVSYDEIIRQDWRYNPYNYNPQLLPQTPNNFRMPYVPQMQVVKGLVDRNIEAKLDADEEVTK